MGKNQPSDVSRVQYVHEAAFSLNLSFMLMALVFIYAPYNLTSHLNRLEFFIQRLLHIRQTDLILGYWEFFLPGTLLAFGIWMTLRLSSRLPLTGKTLRSFGGVVALAAPAAYWLSATYSTDHRYGWSPFRAVQFYEALLVLVWVLLYLTGKWPAGLWVSVLVLLLHYSFWLWQFWPNLQVFLTGNGGSPAILSVLAMGAGWAWWSYVQQRRDVHFQT